MACSQCGEHARRVAELDEQLTQSEEDRNFVKSLWRQVQVENTDIGMVVNTVLDRVSKQNQDKDRNILNILQDKDNQLSSLKNEISWCESSLAHEREENGGLARQWERKQASSNELISQLEEQLAIKNLELSDPNKQKELVEMLDQNKTSLQKQLCNMREDLKSCVSQINALKVKHEDQLGENTRLVELLASRGTELDASTRQLDSHRLIICELKATVCQKREDVAVLREQLNIAETDVSSALKALEKSDRALQTLQHDTLERERSQHSQEEQYQISLEKLNETIFLLEEKITTLVENQNRQEKDALKSCVECSKSHGKLAEQERRLAEAEKSVQLLGGVKEKCARYLQRPLATQDIPDVVDIILADVSSSSNDLDRASKLVKQLQLNCKEKDVAFGQLRAAHDTRLDRMSSLQEYLSEALDEVKLLDKDRWKELYCDFRDVAHAPQPLRHEDSSTVWSDLQHYKTLCAKLKREFEQVEERHSQLMVQRTTDIDTFNEMKAAVLVDQRECGRKLRVANHHSICGCNLQVELMRDKAEEFRSKNEELNSENVQLLSALQAELAKVSQFEECKVKDSATQTPARPTTVAATLTDGAVQVNRPESTHFTNTMTLLDRLTLEPNKENQRPNRAAKKAGVMRGTQKAGVMRGTQTLTQPPVRVLQKPPAAMKIRLASLNQQVAVLTKAKHRHSKDLGLAESAMQQVEGQLSTALRQLSTSQNLVSSLNEDVRISNEEVQEVRDQLHELQNATLRQSELATLQDRNVEIKKLNHQNNLLSSQISNLTSAVAKLKSEIEEKSLAFLKLEDKSSRSDKILRQQRTDNEHLRQALSQTKCEASEQVCKAEDLSKRLRKVQDVAENRKNYIDTLKSQLSNAKVNVEKSKGQHEECRAALETKTKDLKAVLRNQDSTDKMTRDIKMLATRQLEEQAAHFCESEQKLNQKLVQLSKRSLQWEKCIRQAVGSMVDKIKQEKDKRVVASSLSSEEYSRAKHLSSSLLNLTEADFHDIMSSTRVQHSIQSGSTTGVWKGQLAKILSLEDFGPVLANSLCQLFEEYAKAVAGEVTSRSSVYTGNSLTHNSEDEKPVKLLLSEM